MVRAVFLRASTSSHVEDSDTTIVDAAAREVYEETGLTLAEILAEIPPFEYTIDKTLLPEAGDSLATISKTTIQLNFVATIGSNSSAVPSVKINHEEHQHHAWVSGDELGYYAMTDEMRVVVRNALA